MAIPIAVVGDIALGLPFYISATGYLLGAIVEPDLDIPLQTESENIVLEGTGLLGKLWIIYWKPYSKIPHRNALSHMPLLSTAIRMAYLLIPALAFAYWQYGYLPSATSLRALYLGLATSDIFHITADVFWSWIFRKRRKG